MARYELSLSPSYVKHWTYLEAVREVFQNAIDQQTTNPDNSMAFRHDGKVLKIHSKNSRLEKSSLLLGNTDKADDPAQIGSFGEGYKLAMLVLARDGFGIEIHNYACKEVWTPKIIKSRRYGSDILVVDVKKWHFTTVPDNDLTFVITGIDEEMFEEIRKRVLFLQQDVNKVHTKHGDILIDESQRGKVYVKGLFVEDMSGRIEYGYDMKSETVALDRDRRAVNTFQLVWDTSMMWASVAKEYPDEITELINKDSEDIRYITKGLGTRDVATLTYDSFKEKYGDNAIPASTQYDVDKLRKSYPGNKIIVTTPTVSHLVLESDGYKSYVSGLSIVKDKSPKEILNDFYDEHLQDSLNKSALDAFDKVLELSEGWVQV